MESWGATRRRSVPLAGESGVGALAAIPIAALAALAIIGTTFPYLADSRLQVAVAADAEGRLDGARAAAVQANGLAPQESVYIATDTPRFRLTSSQFLKMNTLK